MSYLLESSLLSGITAKPENVEVLPTFEGLMHILQESREEMFTLEGSMYITDTIIENKVTMEGADVVPLLENFVGGVFKKLKAVWTKIWSKIRSWYNAVINKWKAMTLSGEKFISQFGDTLKKKTKVGFTYKGFKWDFPAFVSAKEAIEGGLQKAFGDSFKDFAEVKKAIGAHDMEVLAASLRNKETKDITRDVDDAIKGAFGTHGKSYSDAADKLRKVAHSDKDTTDEIKDFSVLSVETMIDVVKNGKTEITKLKRIQSDEDADYQKIINEIDDAASKALNARSTPPASATDAQRKESVESNTHATSLFSAMSSAMQKVKTNVSSLNGLHVSLFEGYYKECQSVLKSFLSFKGKKATTESFTLGDDETGEGLLESAFNLL